jgi:hypothetical protein
MTQPDDDTGSAGKTFTQAEVDKLIKDRLARERAKYADYDELKAAAEEGNKSKTQLDKVSEQLAALTTRAEKAEAAQARQTVISTKLKGVPASIAKRLSGKTVEELEADADQLLADWKEAGGKVADADGGKDEQDGDDGKGSRSAAPAQNSRRRPTEDLRSGAPTTTREPDENDPLKLAAMIPRN